MKKDYGFLGCSGNVLQFMDNICSGKEECKIDVADQELIDQVPCLEELSPYLEAGYICQTGESQFQTGNKVFLSRFGCTYFFNFCPIYSRNIVLICVIYFGES